MSHVYYTRGHFFGIYLFLYKALTLHLNKQKNSCYNSLMKNNYEVLKEMINECRNIVVFSGAGISVPSGIPDFRSADGIYNQKTKLSATP